MTAAAKGSEKAQKPGPNGARRYSGIRFNWTSTINKDKPTRTAAGVSTLPPLMANQELPATTGGARSIAIVGNSGGGRDDTVYSRSVIIEVSTTNDVMPRPNSTRDTVA